MDGDYGCRHDVGKLEERDGDVADAIRPTAIGKGDDVLVREEPDDVEHGHQRSRNGEEQTHSVAVRYLAVEPREGEAKPEIRGEADRRQVQPVHHAEDDFARVDKPAVSDERPNAVEYRESQKRREHKGEVPNTP